MTDGAMYYSPDGEALKRFHTRDAAGISLRGKPASRSPGSRPTIRPLPPPGRGSWKIVHVAFGCHDKVAAAEVFRVQILEWNQLAYMGDDWFDVPLLQRWACRPAPPTPIPTRGGGRLPVPAAAATAQCGSFATSS